ncbi:MAG: CHASE2 domain-containing protein [Phycisphaerales bacterium]
MPPLPASTGDTRQSSRSRMRLCLTIGLAVTLLASLAAAWGWVLPLERPLIDLRARWFSLHTPPPSTHVVHIDIDDAALASIGRWPWPRALLSDVVGELHHAGTSVIAFDLLFDEPQQPRWVPAPGSESPELIPGSDATPASESLELIPGSDATPASESPELIPGSDATPASESLELIPGSDATPASETPELIPGAGAKPGQSESFPGASAAPGSFTRIDDDARFARSIADAGSVVLAVYAPFTTVEGERFTHVIELLRKNPLLTDDQLASQLRLTEAQHKLLAQRLASLKIQAIRQRLFDLFVSPSLPPTLDQCRAAILPDLPVAVVNSPELDILADQYHKVRTLVRLGSQMPAENPGESQLVSMHVPVPPLADAAAVRGSFGSVSYDADPDGVVRSAPLLLNFRHKDWPHFALAIACQYLHVPLDKIQVTPGHITLPGAHFPDGSVADVTIPLLHARPGDHWRLPIHRMFVTWPTNAADWKYLFDPNPRKQDSVQHVPIGRLVEAPRLRRQLIANQTAADDQLIQIIRHPMITGLFNEADVKQFLNQTANPGVTRLSGSGSPNPHQPILDTIAFLRKDLDSLTDPSADDKQFKQFLDDHMARYQLAADAVAAGQSQLDQYEQQLRQAVAGNIAIVGWTATGSVTDVVPTSLHNLAPGVVVHGAVVNALLTRHFIRRGPVWLDVALTLLLGILITLLAARFGPVTALLLTILFCAGYFLLNGLLLFDHMSLLVQVAAPLLAAVAAWVAVTVYRLAIEQHERARITRQFKNYVSRDLVDLIVANPSLIKQGRHELTCLFSDIAGFTTVSEKLGPEQTITLLNDYLRVMTHRVMEHRGTVNKYLGDGMMAFWGAPIDDETHTLNACASALACIDALRELQKEPRFADLPKLFMRVGIATGQMMVGDCGAPPDRSDYTVIGDTVNLASRLESSNKQFGTQMLINERAHELVKEQMLARPIGRIRVVGRSQAETVFELLNTHADATDDQRRLADQTRDALDAFFAADFQTAIHRFTAIRETFGHAKLYDLYLAAAHDHLANGQPPDFDGTLALTTK